MYWMYVCVYMRTNEFLIRPRFLDFSQGLSLLKCVHFNGKENPLFALDNFSSILHRKSGELLLLKRYFITYGITEIVSNRSKNCSIFTRKKTMRRGEEGNLSNKNYSITQFFFSRRFEKKLLNYLTRFFDKVIFYITYIKLG